ncbi:hypothetical protein MMC14_002116 [Varicellaria rhodocarpa]|nr:hypothetical protein [Varicellaria rhodocarpa]
MRFHIFATIVGLLTLTTAATTDAQKQVVISYPSNTPDSILDKAKYAITAAGGVITHEYKLIKGFAASVSTEALATINTLSTEFAPTIEEDQIITAYESSK